MSFSPRVSPRDASRSARRRRLRSALGLAAISLVFSAAAARDEVAEWSDATATALFEERYRGRSPVERIVAIRCSVALEAEEGSDPSCTALRWKLAEAMTRRGFEVVEPRSGFEAVATWDHVDCGREDAPEYLGWSVVEIRMASPESRRSGDGLAVTALETLRGTVLHVGEIDPDGLQALSGYPGDARSSARVVSRTEPGEEALASRLAEKIVCALKDLPEKPTIDTVTVVGTVSSPAERDWARRVGDRLAAHLDRVLRSGYVREGGATLELEIDPLGGRAFRVVPRVVDVDVATGERAVLVDGDSACAHRDCVVEIVGALPGREARPHGTRAALWDIGDALGISDDAVRQILKAVRVESPAAARLERALLAHDPRVDDVATLFETWQAWDELAGLSAAGPDGNAVSGFAQEVAFVLWERLRHATLDTGGR